MFIDYLYGKRIGFIEALKMAEIIFSKNMKSFFKIMLYLFLPINIVIGIIDYLMTDVMRGFDPTVIMESSEKIQAFMETAEYSLLNRYNIVIMIIQMFVVPLAAMAVAKVTYNYFNDEESSVKAIIIEALSKGSTLIIATLIYFVILVAGFMVIIPGVIFLVFFVFYVYAIMLKDAKAFESLKMSFRMVRKKWFRVAFYSLFFYILQMLISQGILLILGFLTTNVVTAIIASTLASLGQIIYFIAMTILFLNIDKGGYYVVQDRKQINR